MHPSIFLSLSLSILSYADENLMIVICPLYSDTLWQYPAVLKQLEQLRALCLSKGKTHWHFYICENQL